jgi:hypothetical protein
MALLSAAPTRAQEDNGPEVPVITIRKPGGPSGAHPDDALIVEALGPARRLIETCDSKNNYLEEGLAERHVLPTVATDIPIACFASSLSQGANPGRYFKCKSPTGQAQKTEHRPCVSPQLVAASKSAFDVVASCFGIPPRVFFQILHHESRFSPSLVSPTGAGGVGQLVEASIADANTQIAKEPHPLNNMAGKECGALKAVAGPFPMVDDSRCDRVAVPPNPLRSMVYAAVQYLSIQEASMDVFSEYIARMETVTGKDYNDIWSPHLQNSIKEDVAIAMYNGGRRGIRAVFRTYLQSLQGQPSLEEFRGGFRQALRQHYASTSETRKAEVANYNVKVRDELTQTEERAGVACQ